MWIITTGRMPDIRSVMAASASWLLPSAGGLGGQVWMLPDKSYTGTPPPFPVSDPLCFEPYSAVYLVVPCLPQVQQELFMPLFQFGSTLSSKRSAARIAKTCQISRHTFY